MNTLKRMLQVVVLILIVVTSNAQTFDEWFKQKKTQRKYLIEQIAALRAYLDYINKGYSIAQDGLSTIGKIRNGDFDLHKGFFGSLKNINSAIKTSTKVPDIISFEIRIVQVFKETYKQVRTSELFNSVEVKYIYKVFATLLSDCADITDALISVTTDNKLQMKDDDRLERINSLYSNMQDNYTFAKSFSAETKLLEVQRTKEKNELKTVRTFYELK